MNCGVLFAAINENYTDVIDARPQCRGVNTLLSRDITPPTSGRLIECAEGLSKGRPFACPLKVCVGMGVFDFRPDSHLKRRLFRSIGEYWIFLIDSLRLQD